MTTATTLATATMESKLAELGPLLAKLAAFGDCYPALVAVVEADVAAGDFKGAIKSLKSPRPYIGVANMMACSDVSYVLHFLLGWQEAAEREAARLTA